MTREETIQELRENVNRGAELFDKHIPNWVDTVQGAMIRGEFEMSEPNNCALGTLELVEIHDGDDPRLNDPRLIDPKVMLNGVVITSWNSAEAYEYGFNYDDTIENDWVEETGNDVGLFTILNQLWAEAVAERKGIVNA